MDDLSCLQLLSHGTAFTPCLLFSLQTGFIGKRSHGISSVKHPASTAPVPVFWQSNVGLGGASPRDAEQSRGVNSVWAGIKDKGMGKTTIILTRYRKLGFLSGMNPELKRETRRGIG